MFKNGIDLKSLGIWNLVITAIVLLMRLLAGPDQALTSELWALPLFTLGLGLLLVYRGTKRLDTGNAVIRARMLLFVGALSYVTVKYQSLPTEKAWWLFGTATVLLLAALAWYFVRWWSRKTVAI